MPNRLADSTSPYLLQHADNPVDWYPWGEEALMRAKAEDKPILLDYYMDTHVNKAFMGEDQETKEKMLVKGTDEFTSLIQKVYKVQEDYIVMTENSIYVVSGKVQKRGIKAAADREIGIIEGVVAPVLAKHDTASRSRAAHYALEISNQFAAIHSELVRSVISKMDQ